MLREKVVLNLNVILVRELNFDSCSFNILLKKNFFTTIFPCSFYVLHLQKVELILVHRFRRRTKDKLLENKHLLKSADFVYRDLPFSSYSNPCIILQKKEIMKVK